MTLRRVAVVRKTSAVEKQSKHQDTKLAQAIAAGDPLADRVLLAHAEHVRTADLVTRELAARRLTYRVVRNLTPALAAWADFIITVGGDGTFLGASHLQVPSEESDGPPMLGVNSAVSSSVGYFCAATGATFAAILDDIVAGRQVSAGLGRMRVAINAVALPVLVLNDVLLAHKVPAETSRYVLSLDGRQQDQKSSGIWVSTAAGSTAALRAAGGWIQPLESRTLQYRVREPMSWTFRGAPLVAGLFDSELTVISRMMAGAVYLDGGHLQASFGFGDRVTFSPAPRAMPWIRPADVELRRRADTPG